ncbi:unnamed protein product [Arctia plantaginis]|uniref:THAP-type domain-containing protein n=1 Tax=Arctia plantaginis TaxID=874455 RepID=A0A8S1BPU6_ARCPL|nr:unnamed protein product [Arctia plantaginis]
MPSCVVKWCRSRSDMKNTGITFHKFPINKIQREKWVSEVRLERNESDWRACESSRICSIHFRSEDIYVLGNGKRKRLKKSALPICTMVSRLPANVNPSDDLTSITQNTNLQVDMGKHKENYYKHKKNRGRFKRKQLNVTSYFKERDVIKKKETMETGFRLTRSDFKSGLQLFVNKETNQTGYLQNPAEFVSIISKLLIDILRKKVEHYLGRMLFLLFRHLRNQRKSHSENLDKDPSTESLHSSTTIEETHDPFGMAVDEETSSPDITVATSYN